MLNKKEINTICRLIERDKEILIKCLEDIEEGIVTNIKVINADKSKVDTYRIDYNLEVEFAINSETYIIKDWFRRCIKCNAFDLVDFFNYDELMHTKNGCRKFMKEIGYHI